MTFDPKPYAEGLKRARQARTERIRQQAEMALEEARRLAAAIGARDPGVRRVILFGSLAEGTPRRPHFDIDLALDGGDPQAALELTEAAAFAVDVVDLGRVPPYVRQRIEGRGTVLFSRAGGQEARETPRL
ncbi:MAG: nucleotidyltransferase domain-containing protein [Candidatus Latescibacterota bacterium]